MAKIRFVMAMALGSIPAFPARSIVICSILTFGALLVFIGFSAMHALEGALQKNVEETLGGDLVIAASSTSEDLDVFAPWEELDVIENTGALVEKLVALDGVDSALPFFGAGCQVVLGNPLDRAASSIRMILRTRSLTHSERETFRERVLTFTDSLDSKDERVVSLGNRFNSDDFWIGFDADPMLALEALENELAPSGSVPSGIWISYAATNPTLLAAATKRLRFDLGALPNPEDPAIIVTAEAYRSKFQTPFLKSWSEIVEELESGASPATTLEKLAGLRAGLRTLGAALRPGRGSHLDAQLRRSGFEGQTRAEALNKLFTFGMEDFGKRRQLIETVLSNFQTHSIGIGDSLVLEAMGNDGHSTSVEVTLAGVYEFEGLGELPQLANVALLTSPARQVLAGADRLPDGSAGGGAQPEDVDSAALAFFGAPGDLEEETVLANDAIDVEIDRVSQVLSPNLNRSEYIAVRLKDGVSAQPRIASLLSREYPGLEIAGWRKSAGTLGLYLGLVSLQVLLGLGVIFFVAFLVVNMALVIVVLQRTRELGTLRALGTSKGAALGIILVESAILSLAGGLIAGLVGFPLLTWIASEGIPSTHFVTTVIYGGKSLHPHPQLWAFVVACLATVAVAIVATLFPGRLAMSVSPIEAMRSDH